MEEIWASAVQFKPNKSHEPDGLQPIVFQKFWANLKTSFQAFISKASTDFLNPHGYKTTFFVSYQNCRIKKQSHNTVPLAFVTLCIKSCPKLL